MIYTVTLNPALDYDMYLDADIKVGELNLTKEAILRTGGKGINVSRMMKTLDVQNTALGYVA
ncbi:MAG: 1-phosphofructokinase, partial [Leptotrichiaceae bacterium]